MSHYLTLFQESFSDITENGISFVIFGLLIVICVALFAAMFSHKLRRRLVAVRLLEHDETPGSLLLWLVGIIVLVKFVQSFLVQPFIVDGGSMLPTFESRDFLLVDKASYLYSTPKRGDVVVFKYYGHGDAYGGKYLIKRIIGVPGDIVSVRDGVTTVFNKENPNGVVLDESFITHKDVNQNVEEKLGEDEYFVMGDNRGNSYDSRRWGALHVRDIRGKAIVRMLPASHFDLNPGHKNLIRE